jgi:hypothetical protein
VVPTSEPALIPEATSEGAALDALEAIAQPDASAPRKAAAPEALASEEAVTTPPLDAAPVSGSGSRIRRTRTLADVVQPEYATTPPSEEPAAPTAEDERPLERGTPSRPLRAPGATQPLAEITEPVGNQPSTPMRAAPAGPLAAAPAGPFGAGAADPTWAPMAGAPAADDPLRTVPFPRRPIPRPPRGPLSGHLATGGAHATSSPSALSPSAAAPAPSAEVSLATRLLWSIQRGSPRLVLTAALGHVCVGLGLAVVASVVFLVSGAEGYTVLAIAAVTLIGGIAGYALVTTDRPAWAGALAMVAAQLAALALVFSVTGAQVAALLFAPAAAYLAQRMGGRTVAIISGAGAVMVYLVFVIVGLIWPSAGLHDSALLFFNLVAAVGGTALLLVSLLTAATARERGEAAARARLYEVRLLRARLAEVRESTERNARALEEALVSALRGRGIEPVAAEGTLSAVAEITNDVADRLATLQKDREDRLRLEGAVRAVVRALERGWHGMPWAWPEPSGTQLDQLIAYLRTPRPREQGTPLPWGDEAPTIVPRPTRAGISRPLAEPRSDPNISRPLAESRTDPDIARVFSTVDEQWDLWPER